MTSVSRCVRPAGRSIRGPAGRRPRAPRRRRRHPAARRRTCWPGCVGGLLRGECVGGAASARSCVIGVRCGKQARRPCEPGSIGSAVIARPVEALVVRCARPQRVRREAGAVQDALRLVGVQPHLLPVVGRQRRRLLPDPGRHGDPPDVVDQRRAPNRRDSSASPNRHCRAARAANVRHAGGVPDQVRGVRSAKSPMAASARSIDSPSRIGCGARLAGERFVPCRRVASSARNWAASSARVPRPPDRTRDRPARGRPRRHVSATEHPLERGVSGDVNDPHRQRYLPAPRTSWLALAVQRSAT